MMTHTARDDHGCIPPDQYVSADMLGHCRIELSSDLLDEQGTVLDHVICFAFDTLHVRVVHIRVVHVKDCLPTARQDFPISRPPD